MNRKCSTCKEVKPLTLEFFPKETSRKFGYGYTCKQCKKLISRNKIIKSYNITLLEYNTLYVKQKGMCAICENTCITGKNLAIDHDHKTKTVRGLLCINCNKGLGHFKDSLPLLKKAINYLSSK